jgi:hypothetical protein
MKRLDYESPFYPYSVRKADLKAADVLRLLRVSSTGDMDAGSLVKVNLYSHWRSPPCEEVLWATDMALFSHTCMRPWGHPFEIHSYKTQRLLAGDKLLQKMDVALARSLVVVAAFTNDDVYQPAGRPIRRSTALFHTCLHDNLFLIR